MNNMFPKKLNRIIGISVSFEKVMQDFLDEFKYQYIINIENKNSYNYEHNDFSQYDIKLKDHIDVMQIAAINALAYINDRYEDICNVSCVFRNRLKNNYLTEILEFLIGNEYSNFFTFKNDSYKKIIGLKNKKSKLHVDYIISRLQKKNIDRITSLLCLSYKYDKYTDELKNILNSNLFPLLYVNIEKENTKKLFIINSIFEYIPITEDNFLDYFFNILVFDLPFNCSPNDIYPIDNNHYEISSEKINAYRNAAINNYIFKNAYLDIIKTTQEIMKKYNFQLIKIEEMQLINKSYVLSNIKNIRFNNIKYKNYSYDIENSFSISLIDNILHKEKTLLYDIKSNISNSLFGNKECLKICKIFYDMLYDIKTNTDLNQKIQQFLNIKNNNTDIKRDVAKNYFQLVQSKGIVNFLVSVKYSNSDYFFTEKPLNYFTVL